MLAHRLEVPIGVQEDVAVLNAEGRDDHVDRSADRDRSLAQGPVVHRAGERNLAPEQISQGQRVERMLRALEISLATEALQDLDLDQIPDKDLLLSKEPVQEIRLARISAVEEVDPDRAVDQDHASVAPHCVEIAFPMELAA
jgi:hypothetical protein